MDGFMRGLSVSYIAKVGYLCYNVSMTAPQENVVPVIPETGLDLRLAAQAEVLDSMGLSPDLIRHRTGQTAVNADVEIAEDPLPKVVLTTGRRGRGIVPSDRDMEEPTLFRDLPRGVSELSLHTRRQIALGRALSWHNAYVRDYANLGVRDANARLVAKVNKLEKQQALRRSKEPQYN